MKTHNKRLKITISMLLAAVMICSLVGASAAALEEQTTSKDKNIAQEINSSPTPSDAAQKEETVYVFADAAGEAKKIIVSDWLKNPSRADALSDFTELKNIINVKGNEDYTVDSENNCVWNAGGNDIYYQGTTDKKLPVDIKISYKLDGKSVSAQEIAGKSGKAVIRFDYINNKKETVKIDGKEESIYVPFVMLTGMILDNKTFTNVEISNGKLLNDGDKSIVMGFAMPGMQENLKIEKDKLEIPSYVEITADVTNFELTTTLTIALNDVFNHFDLSDKSSLDGISASLDELSDASYKLTDGSSELYKGLETLLEESQKLTAGVSQLYDGADTLYNGTSALYSGAVSLDEGIAALSDGASALNEGLGTLTSNSGSLTNGAKQVFETLLSSANSQIAAAGLEIPALTIDNYKSVLNEAAASIDRDTVYKTAYNTALEKVTSAVKAQEAMIRSQVESAVRAKVTENVLTAAGHPMTAEDYEKAAASGLISQEMKAQIETAVSAQMNDSSIISQIDSTTAAKIEELINTNMQSDEVTSQINAALAKAEAGASNIRDLIDQLNNYNSFYEGIISYTAGVENAYNGSSELVSGAKQLSDGSSNLSNGTSELKNGAGALLEGLEELNSASPSLISGISHLKDGAMQLSDGMKEFYEEGIQKIIDVLGGDLEGLVTQVDKICSVSKEYQSFAGISKNIKGSVKFIYKTDSIETK